MKFVDEVTVAVIAGDGGDGCSSFRREKYVPRGGPDGGSGGNGGSVFLKGSRALQTLADLEYHNRYVAWPGGHGKGKDMTGRAGEDHVIKVPLGTEAWDGELRLGEVTRDGELLLVARGGRGGRGNTAFKTQSNVAPRNREEGEPGEQRKLKLVLRMMSDVGLVGFPNAGKSSLLGRITRAQPRIADYPFTTLSPNLGALLGGETRFTVADLPGIIEGAAQGKGLGLRFLRHIERTGALVFVIDASLPKPLGQYRALVAEIRAYNPAILNKPGILVYNKTDLLAKLPAKPRTRLPFLAVSALTGAGIPELVALLEQTLAGEKPA